MKKTNKLSIKRSPEEKKEARRVYNKAYKQMHKEEHATYNKAWYQENKEKVKERFKAYRATHKEEIATYGNAWRQVNKEKSRAWRQLYPEVGRRSNLKCLYNLTQAEWDQIFINQEGKCAICGIHQDSLKQSLFVDHNHDTGKIRGLLCHHCNTGIGMLKDDPIILKKATEYLEFHDIIDP